MAKAFSDARGDEKKAIAKYIEYRAAQLAQEAKEELRQKRRAEQVRRAAQLAQEAREQAAEQAAAREQLLRKRKAYHAVLSALFGVVTLIFGLFTIFWVYAAIYGALNHDVSQQVGFAGILTGLVVAIVCGLVAVACGLLTSKHIRDVRAGFRKNVIETSTRAISKSHDR